MSRSTVRVDTSSSSASSFADRRPRCWSSRRSERRRSARTAASMAEKHDTRCRDYARGWAHDNEQRPPSRLPLGPGLGGGEGPRRRPGGARPADARPEYDVRALLGHLVATVVRARVIAEGGDPTTMPVVVTGVPDDGWPAELAAAIDKAMAAWSDDAVLDREATVPWGRVPGRQAIWGYLNEALVHGWDLAVATGQHSEADPALAEAGLAAGAGDPARELPRRPRAVRRGRDVRRRTRARPSGWPTGRATAGSARGRARPQRSRLPVRPAARRLAVANTTRRDGTATRRHENGDSPGRKTTRRGGTATHRGGAYDSPSYRARGRYGTIQAWRHPGARGWRRRANAPSSPRWSCSSTWCSCSRSPRSPT